MEQQQLKFKVKVMVMGEIRDDAQQQKLTNTCSDTMDQQQQLKVPSPPRLPLPLSCFNFDFVPLMRCYSILVLACCSELWPSKSNWLPSS